MAIFSFLLTLLAGFAAMTPAAAQHDDSDLDASMRNVCDGINAAPILYHEYWEDSCPAPIKFLPDGSCGSWDDAINECVSFCQVRTYWEWATEAPFPRLECHWPVECEISESDSTSVGWSMGVASKIGKALKLGISGSWSSSWSEAHGRSWKVSPEKGTCGYFTFVAVKKVTCGTISEGEVRHGFFVDYCEDVINYHNYCASQVRNVEGKPDGIVLFVRTDCATREPLGPEFQDPVYDKPGVRLDRGNLISVMEGWTINTCTAPAVIAPPVLEIPWYRVLEIKGKGFLDSELGENGEKLLALLRQCGTVVEDVLSFKWAPDDKAYHWVVQGHFAPDAAKRCFGDAIWRVGGSNYDQCT